MDTFYQIHLRWMPNDLTSKNKQTNNNNNNNKHRLSLLIGYAINPNLATWGEVMIHFTVDLGTGAVKCNSL